MMFSDRKCSLPYQIAKDFPEDAANRCLSLQWNGREGESNHANVTHDAASRQS